MVARWQLIQLGFSERAIDHRLATGRLHRLWAGVYAVGRPEVSRLGRWMAATLACGEGAVLSHASAAALWTIREQRWGDIELSAPVDRRRPGIRVHCRKTLEPWELTRHHGIPVTHPVTTLIDLAPDLTPDELEGAISEADNRGLTSPPAIRDKLEALPGRPGVAIVRTRLDRRTFRVTRSRLERRFIPLAHEVGLWTPETRQWVNGYEVDFYWRELGLIVETDGLGYHRTPAQQAEDRRRDQAHTAAGMTNLRFTHEQVFYEPDHVKLTLGAVAGRLLR